ncbi:MAG: sulfatase-like hydrolase/transferase [Treponema sp.]|nr:sulfatase-like hydrolase/transferase [Treponema sp.]
MNYVIFFPDEMRAESLSIYGHPHIRTPNYDRIAREGVTFEQCHVQSPFCSPSRCSLVTGQYVHSCGHRTLWNLIKSYEHNLFRYMKETGYEVRVYGKNDLFSPESIPLSTDEFKSMRAYGPNPGSKPVQPLQICNDFLFHPIEGEYRDHSDYQNLKAGMDFIKSRKSGDKPFILFLPLTFPHCPYTAHEPFYSMYNESDIVPLKSICSNKPEYHTLIRSYRNLEKSNLKKIQAVYMGMISFTDTLLGELMDCVENAGIKEETMLIASADHGDYAGDYGLVEKWSSGCEDVLTRVPLVIAGPGCRKGHQVTGQVELFDIMATIMESAGITPRHTHYARSLWPELKGSPGDPRRAVFCEGGYNTNEYEQCNEGADRPSRLLMKSPENVYYPKGLQQREYPESIGRSTMIRTMTHKLILRTYGDHELYDLAADQNELNNVYGQKSYASVQAELEQRMLDWYIATSDSVPMEEDPRGL